MHQQLQGGMKRAEHDVKRHPGNEQPASPVATVKHEDAGDNRSDPHQVDHPMSIELCDPLCESYTAERQHPAEKRYAAEHYEKPTDYCDGSGTLLHGAGLQPEFSAPLVQHCAAAKREGREPGTAQQQQLVTPRRHAQHLRRRTRTLLIGTRFSIRNRGL